MAVNITLAGTISNSSNIAIDANVQVFVYNSANELTKWSNIRPTELTDYNINIGDPDLSGVDNLLAINNTAGEYVVIAVWDTGTRTDITSIPNEFAFIVHELSGLDVYVQNIQLNKPNSITCSNWSITTPILFNENIIATNNNTNQLTYIEYSKDHFLYQYYTVLNVNELIFPYIGPFSVTYDFGSGYTTSNVLSVVSPLTAGDVIVNIKVQDYFNNQAICTQTAQVFYNIYPDFTWSPLNPTTGTEIFIKDNTTGDVSNIVNIYYTIDGVTYNGSEFYYTPTVYGDIIITQSVVYFDGYFQVTKEITKTITMDNILPEFTFVELYLDSQPTKNIYDFIGTASDIDGTINEIQWEIYRNNPDSNGIANWNLYYSTGFSTNLNNFDWQFDFTDIIGEVKIVGTVKDNLGAIVSYEIILNNPCKSEILSFSNVDWNKTIIKSEWSTLENKIIFEIKRIPIIWDTLVQNRDFTQIIVPKPWVTTVKKTLFKYKIFTKI